MPLPPAIFFINGDISYPQSSPIFVGANPAAPNSYAGFSELTNLQTQLFITDTMTKTEFDARVAADPNYPTVIHLQGLRILVILPDFHDGYNRYLADVVMFLHQGQADIECNRFWGPFGRASQHPSQLGGNITIDYDRDNDDDGYHQHKHGAFGPPSHSFNIQRLTFYELLRANHSPYVVELPSWGQMWDRGNRCNTCNSPFYCDQCHTFSGISTCSRCECRCRCFCNIHAPNCDNIYHNPHFIHRK